MFDASQLFAFSCAAFVLVIVPGPNTMIILTQGLGGRAAGLATVAGVELGTLAHTLFAALGMSALLAASPMAFEVVKFTGAAYLIIIGIRTMLQDAPRIAAAEELRAIVAFRRALVTNLLNPKSALFFLAFLPQFIRPERGHVFLQFVLLGLMVSLIGICIGSTEALAASAIANWLRSHAAFGRWQQRVIGVALIAVALRLAIAQPG